MSTEHMNNGAQTPLTDLLRQIPADARMTYEHSKFHHSLIPVGRLATEAAKRIAELEAENERLRESVQILLTLLDGFTGCAPTESEWGRICRKAQLVRKSLLGKEG